MWWDQPVSGLPTRPRSCSTDWRCKRSLYWPCRWGQRSSFTASTQTQPTLSGTPCSAWMPPAAAAARYTRSNARQAPWLWWLVRTTTPCLSGWICGQVWHPAASKHLSLTSLCAILPGTLLQMPSLSWPLRSPRASVFLDRSEHRTMPTTTTFGPATRHSKWIREYGILRIGTSLAYLLEH